MANLPIILLAAGSSSRMGQSKQLLQWGDKTLIEHQIQTLISTNNSVITVLGSDAEKIIPLIEHLPVSYLINKKWESGMGSSVVAGIDFITKKFPNAEGVLFTLIDQPLVTSSYIKKIIGKFNPQKEQIIASVSDEGWQGVPALFDKFYFEELAGLNGEKGAKAIIKQHLNNVSEIKGGEILEDMDTIEKYEKMLARYISN